MAGSREAVDGASATRPASGLLWSGGCGEVLDASTATVGV